MRYYLGPWVSGEMEGWTLYSPPASTVGSIDLRPLTATDTHGFFALPDDAGVLDSSYALLGQGHIATLLPNAAARSAWQALLGVTPADDALIDWLWQTVTVDADPAGAVLCPPIMPTRRGVLELHLGGHSLIKSKRFSLDLPEAAPVIARLQSQYRQHREDARAGRFGGDPQFHRRILQAWAEKYRVSNPEDIFIPSNVPKERPLPHSTVITESFNTANSDVLGPDLTWVEISGDLDVLSNRVRCDANDSVAYANHALASDDHYAQIEVVAQGGSATTWSALARKDASTTQTFYMGRQNNSSNETELFKREVGTFTRLDNVANTDSLPWTVRLECDGSTIRVLIDGVEKISRTDMAIDGKLYTGIRENITSNDADNFEAGDLAGGTTIPIFAHHYNQMRAA